MTAESKTENWLSLSGATLLAAQIKSVWLERGYRGIKTRVERIAGFEDPLFSVRSNICPDGYPPRKAVMLNAA